MAGLKWLMWVAGGVQAAIIVANCYLPGILRYREHLCRLPRILREIFIIHSCYIVGVILVFAAATFCFAAELTSGHGLGRFMAAVMALFWLVRVPLQLFYYDPSVRRSQRFGDVAFTAAVFLLGSTYAMAALQRAV
jgi:hypothetical protein